MSDTAYNPDTVFPPGDTLREMMDDASMTMDAAVEATGLPFMTLHCILLGITIITPAKAEGLARIGGTAAFWLERDRVYHEWKWEHASTI